MKAMMFNDRHALTQAVLEGRKTQIRRIVPNRTRLDRNLDWYMLYDRLSMEEYKNFAIWRYSRYHVGEVVAVAQSYKSIHEEMMRGNIGDDRYATFRCTPTGETPGWTNKMYVRSDVMPHQIEITDIKVERFQDISDEDCLKEGVIKLADSYRITASDMFFHTAQEAFAALVDKICGRDTWYQNPWMFVYTFKLIK